MTESKTPDTEAPRNSPPPAPLTYPVTSKPRSTRKRVVPSVIFGAVALAGVLVVLYAWQLPPFASPIESTENAQVKGQT
ncbi:HlyD family secretion protein, partial [Pseudomonas fulva]